MTELTGPQLAALRSVGRRRHLYRGEDGVATITIRRLQAMGLVLVAPHHPRPGGWTAQITENGRHALREGERSDG